MNITRTESVNDGTWQKLALFTKPMNTLWTGSRSHIILSTKGREYWEKWQALTVQCWPPERRPKGSPTNHSGRAGSPLDCFGQKWRHATCGESLSRSEWCPLLRPTTYRQPLKSEPNKWVRKRAFQFTRTCQDQRTYGITRTFLSGLL